MWSIQASFFVMSQLLYCGSEMQLNGNENLLKVNGDKAYYQGGGWWRFHIYNTHRSYEVAERLKALNSSPTVQELGMALDIFKPKSPNFPLFDGLVKEIQEEHPNWTHRSCEDLAICSVFKKWNKPVVYGDRISQFLYMCKLYKHRPHLEKLAESSVMHNPKGIRKDIGFCVSLRN